MNYDLLIDSFIATFRGRKIDSKNSKTLVGRCRDRPLRALPLTCPNAINPEKNKKLKRNARTKKNIIKNKNDKKSQKIKQLKKKNEKKKSKRKM